MFCRNRELWETIFETAGPGGSYTTEIEVLGKRLVMCADPENIKAVLATQFHDYGMLLLTMAR